MKILALENSSEQGSVAWCEDDREPLVSIFPNDRRNSAAFFQALGKFTGRFQELDALVVGLGPGSYAGTRIAIAAALGLQAAHGLKLLGLPSICALDEEPNEYYVVGDARRQSLFFARIAGHEIVGEIELHDESTVRSMLEELPQSVPIYATKELVQFKRMTLRPPSASLLARLALRHAGSASHAPLEPIYLRAPNITTPKSAPMLRQ